MQFATLHQSKITNLAGRKSFSLFREKMSSSPPPASPSPGAAREQDPHAAHSDYSSDYASVRRQEPLAAPRPGRGRPRKVSFFFLFS